MLEIKNITKTYGDKIVIDNISFNLNSGELCGFIGSNGAGKSTLIKIITGVINLYEGNVIIDGISLKDTPVEYKKQISYVPDIPYIYEYMTPNVFWDFILDIYEVKNDLRIELIEKYSAMFEMDENINQPISSFSKGMKQKVALISAFLHPSKIYILDEPFSGLDPKSIVELKKIMKDKANEGNSILFSTHLLDVAEKICNRIIGIKSGKKIIDERDKDIISNGSKLENIFIGELSDEKVSVTNEKR